MEGSFVDIDKLIDIIRGCLPQGAVDPEHLPDNVVVIDVHFMKVGVDLDRARARRDELVALLNDYPTEAWGHPLQRLEDGPNYMSVGGAVNDQGRALLLFAIGQALDLWSVITPETQGFTGSQADSMAGAGMVKIDGYRPVRA